MLTYRLCYEQSHLWQAKIYIKIMAIHAKVSETFSPDQSTKIPKKIIIKNKKTGNKTIDSSSSSVMFNYV